MAEADALSKFDFSKVMKGGLFLKWEAGKALTLRVLTTNPMVTTKEFANSDGEINLSTQFHFIVYNFTDSLAQVLSASPSMAKKISDLHTDEDFGANIRNIDIKITPTGEKLTRRYDIQVLPKTKNLTKDEIELCKKVDLEKAIPDGERMSFYKPEEKVIQTEEHTPGVADRNTGEDVEIEDIGDGPINIDDIPF